MRLPKEYKPVLARIKGITCTGLSSWYEVVYFDEDGTKGWKSYAGSITFDDGEYVETWEYADELI